MTPDSVVNYLKQHPEFFEEHADFLASIFVPHPHGGRAVSIGERQILTLREKGRQLEGKLREMIDFGEENDAIGEKVHRLTLALLAAADLESTIELMYLHLRQDFAVPHVALRLWPDSARSRPETAAVSAETRSFATSLTRPQCSAHPIVDTLELFGEQSGALRSFVYIGLKADSNFGLLALASEDPKRFYPEMGTLYLQRLGELTAAALWCYLK